MYRASVQSSRVSKSIHLHTRRACAGVLLLLGLTAGAACQDGEGGDTGGGGPEKPGLLIGNTRGDSISLYDQETGAYLRDFVPAGSGGLKDPDFMLLHDDGFLYVGSGREPDDSAILRYHADTGAPAGVFARGGGLLRPYGLAFGPDDMLYVSSFLSDQLLRYDAVTGEFVDVFAEGDTMPGGLNGPNALVFGPDGLLYVTTQGSVAVDGEATFPGLPSQVLRYDITTGEGSVFIDEPEPSPDSAGFISLLGIVFGPDCDGDVCEVFVSDFANDIRRYDLSGALLDTLPTGYTGTSPRSNHMGGLTFGDGARLFTVGFDTTDPAEPGTILRFDSSTGAALPAAGQSGAVLVAGDTRMQRPVGITAWP